MKTINTPRTAGGFFKLTGRVLLALLIALNITHCSEPDEIGLDLIDNRATFHLTDTVTLTAYTGLSDSVPTNFSFQNMLGVMKDPVFGRIKAGIFTEFRLPRNDFSLGANPVLDSLVLSFGYTGQFYGHVESFQHLRVYELSESFPERDTLYSNLFIQHYPEQVGEKMLRPAPADSVLIDTVMFAPHFSVRLSDALGQKFIDANGTSAFSDVTSFLNYFKGLYIAVDDEVQGTGAVFNLNMFSAFTRLSLYYRVSGDTATRQDFFISEFARRSGYFESSNFEGAHSLLLEQLNGENAPAVGDSLLFVQSMGKLRANIQLPHLKSLKIYPNMAINQASLIIPVASVFSDDTYPAASALGLYRYHDDGSLMVLTDQLLGTDYFGGKYDSEKKQYVFNITRYVQMILDETVPDNGLALEILSSADNAARVVLHGPGRTVNPMKLKIIYTAFD